MPAPFSRLDVYVLRYFLRFFGNGLGFCVGLFVLIETFDRLDEFLEPHVRWSDACRYLLARLPGIIYQMLPAACLLASVVTFSTLSQYQEITAMRAAGVAPLRLLRPLFGCGMLISLVMLSSQLTFVPAATQYANTLWHTRIHPPKNPASQGQIRWQRYDSRVWSAMRTVPEEQRLLGVTLFVLSPQGEIIQRYDAAEARQEAQGWLLREGILRSFDHRMPGQTRVEPFQQHHVAFPERLQELGRERKAPEEMGLVELWAVTRSAWRSGRALAPYMTELHGKIAFAVVCVLMAGCGAPLALHRNRQGGMMRAVGLTLGGGFSYWMVYSFAMAFGYSGYWPPVVAAWSANGCLGMGSLYLAWRLR